MNKIFSDKDIEYIKGNYKSMTYGQIASKLNYTEKQIRSKALNLGLTKTRKFNKKYFQRITTPNQAYWLGLIYADGYLVHNKKLSNYELGIELINTDHKLLDDLNVELGGVHKVVFFHKEKNFNGYEYETDTCALRIYSKTIVDDLIKCGVVPNKTYSSIYPKCENFIWDFIRGFLDGDGCIYVNTKNYITVKFTNSNVDFLNHIKNIIEAELQIEGSIYQENSHKYQLVYYRQTDVHILLQHIYYTNHNQHLDRKYQIYHSYYGLAN